MADGRVDTGICDKCAKQNLQFFFYCHVFHLQFQFLLIKMGFRIETALIQKKVLFYNILFPAELYRNLICSWKAQFSISKLLVCNEKMLLKLKTSKFAPDAVLHQNLMTDARIAMKVLYLLLPKVVIYSSTRTLKLHYKRQNNACFSGLPLFRFIWTTYSAINMINCTMRLRYIENAKRISKSPYESICKISPLPPPSTTHCHNSFVTICNLVCRK